MKKVTGILIVLAMVISMVNVAFGDMEEVYRYVEENGYLDEFVMENYEAQSYNIVGGCAYTIGNLVETEDLDIYEFMEWYPRYLEEHFPKFAEDVIIEFTYAGDTENYVLVTVWLTLENGKVFSDYLYGEPAVSEMAGIMACKK